MIGSRLIWLVGLVLIRTSLGQTPISLRYFYDDANELYRVLDSTGTLIEYTYDPSGNIINVSRTSLPSNQLTIFNVTPSNTVGGSKIIILGQNFSSISAGETVLIGGVPATVVSATSSQLVVIVPPGTPGGTVSVTVNGVTATWSNTITVAQAPFITSLTPAAAAKSTIVTVAVTGSDLLGATFALLSVDPVNTTGGAVSLSSGTDTTASLTFTLGSTEGQFALISTNSIGTGTATPGSLFLIGPSNNSVSFYASVLNTAFNPTVNPLLPAGQNTASFLASVLNTSDNLITNPPFPPGHNAIDFYTSVLNTGFNPTKNPPLPAGQNAASFFASVLNTSDNLITNPPFPPGHNAVSAYISVCNTSSGCVANSPAVLSAKATQAATTTQASTSTPSGRLVGATPVLEPLAGMTSVTVGQTIRLTAQNVDPGSTVEFDVNRTAIATVTEAPYQTLFTVPDGTTELAFHIVVRAAGTAEILSQNNTMIVAPDVGASISGSIAGGAKGLELSLAAGGLKAEYFHLTQPVTALPILDAMEPVRSAYVTAINEPNPQAVFGDDPLGVHLAPDYAVRFSGEVRADTTGQYRFWLTTRNGAAVWIDGKLLADSTFAANEPAETPFSVALDQGWHSIQVIYYLAVGLPSVRLEWQPSGSIRREVLGPEYLRTVLSGMTTVSASDGTFTFSQVPTKFDSVWIRVKQGTKFTEFPPVKPGSSAVSIAVPN